MDSPNTTAWGHWVVVSGILEYARKRYKCIGNAGEETLL